MRCSSICRLGVMAICAVFVIDQVSAREYTFDELEKEPVEQLINTYYKQIGTLKGQFAVMQEGKVLMDVSLDWDRSMGFVNATLQYPKSEDKPLNIRTWVLNDRREWSARPGSELSVPGAWDVKVSPAGSGILPVQLNHGEYRLNFLTEALTPYILRHQQPETMKARGARIGVSETRDEETGMIDRVYTISVEGQVLGRITCTMDRSDGLRVHRTYVENFTDGVPKPILIGEYKGFTKSNGIWFPKDIKESELLNGKMQVAGHVVFRDIVVNEPMTAENFEYLPPYGSLVTDTQSGLMFRAGYADPLRITKPDEDPLDNLPDRDPSITTPTQPMPLRPREGGNTPGKTQKPGPGAGTPVHDEEAVGEDSMLPVLLACSAVLMLGAMLALWWRRRTKAGV